MQTIGERIIFLREERDISQKALALTIDITATTLSRYENNIYEPKAEIISRLVKALDTTADFLLGLQADYHPRSSDSSQLRFTSEEYRLIKHYRELSALNRARIDERILTLLESEKENEKNYTEPQRQMIV